MKKLMLLALALVSSFVLAACGGGSGGSSLTCAPTTLSPTTTVAGTWQIYVDNINSDCPTPPEWIRCTVTMSQASDGNVTITPTANCTVSVAGYESSDYTTMTSAAAAVSGSTFYWVATTLTSIEALSYSETDTVTCNTVANFVDGVQTNFSSTSTYAGATGEGSCTSTATATFTQQ